MGSACAAAGGRRQSRATQPRCAKYSARQSPPARAAAGRRVPCRSHPAAATYMIVVSVRDRAVRLHDPRPQQWSSTVDHLTGLAECRITAYRASPV